MSQQTYITLNNGLKIPQFGMGVFMVPEGEETVQACLTALKLGYRHIDTAHAYQNERSVGQAVRESGIPREEIWVTSKLWPSEYGEGKTMEGIDKMLKRLDIGYLDLLLLHQQVGDYMGPGKTWRRRWPRGRCAPSGLVILSRTGWKRSARRLPSSPRCYRWSATPIISRRP